MMSTKKHGHWVRLKDSDREGQIAYYDTTEKLVWVVWRDQKTTGASGHLAKELVLTPYEPDPWFREEIIGS